MGNGIVKGLEFLVNPPQALRAFLLSYFEFLVKSTKLLLGLQQGSTIPAAANTVRVCAQHSASQNHVERLTSRSVVGL